MAYLQDQSLALGIVGNLVEIPNHGGVRIAILHNDVIPAAPASEVTLRFLNYSNDVLRTTTVIGDGKKFLDIGEDELRLTSTFAIKMEVLDQDETAGAIDVYLNPIPVDER